MDFLKKFVVKLGQRTTRPHEEAFPLAQRVLVQLP
jgi:hypothetical protein